MPACHVRLLRHRWLTVVLAACAILALVAPTSLELRRTSCAGLCPAYTIIVWSNGLVQFHGDLALADGDQLSYIGPFQAQHLMTLALIFGLPFYGDSYANGNIDFPGTSTCLTAILYRKCVSTGFSMEPTPDPPFGLGIINGAIDAYTNSKRWIGTDDQLLEKYIHSQRP